MVVLTGAAVRFALLLLSFELWAMNTRPCWSQVQQQSSAEDHEHSRVPIADLRVGQSSTICSGAPRAKFSGGSSLINFSPARKRAFRRARQRAALHGHTVYRGQLQCMGRPGAPVRQGVSWKSVGQANVERARLRAQTWNMSGCTAELYDVRWMSCFFRRFTGAWARPRHNGALMVGPSLSPRTLTIVTQELRLSFRTDWWIHRT